MRPLNRISIAVRADFRSRHPHLVPGQQVESAVEESELRNVPFLGDAKRQGIAELHVLEADKCSVLKPECGGLRIVVTSRKGESRISSGIPG